jgi:putative membrane protein
VHTQSGKLYHVTLLTSFIAFLLLSAIRPHDYFTWFLEVIPAIICVKILVYVYRKFKFTNLVYSLIWIHALILIIGGHYTYAEVPLFNWLKEVLDLSRNHYDRIGHFAQGFIPAMVTREILLRTSPLKPGKWLSVIVVCICLAISASYELIEWGVAELTGSAADAFLGTQGDVWDTQWDMLLAFCGAISSLVALSGLHDQQLKGILIRKREV